MYKRDENGNVILDFKEDPEFYCCFFDIKFFYDNKKMFFKQCNGISSNVYSELVAGKIGEKIGLNVLKVKPAVYICDKEKIYGMISQNYVTENDIRITYNDYCEFSDGKLKNTIDYNDLIDAIKKYIDYEKLYENIDIKLDKNFYKDLQSIIFFDFLTFQADRAVYNVEFLLKKQKNSWILSVSPIFDNSMCFRGNSQFKLDKKTKQPEFLFGYNNKFDTQGLKDEIKKRLKYNQNYQKMAVKAYNIDINDCFEEIEIENPNFKFDQNIKDIISESWAKTLDILKNHFNIEEYLCQNDNIELTK